MLLNNVIYVLFTYVSKLLCCKCDFVFWRISLKKQINTWFAENPYKICLPLPPPLGCKPSRMGTVEVIDKDTNYFKYLVLLSAFISFAACIMVILLAKKLLLDIMGSQKAKRVPSYLFLLAGLFYSSIR